MIRIWDIVNEVTSAISGSAAVTAIGSSYSVGVQIHKGDFGEVPLQDSQKGPLVFIMMPEQPYDVGATGNADREVSVGIFWALHSENVVKAGNVSSYTACDLCDQLGAAILQAIRDIPHLGDMATSMAYTIDSDNWPHVAGAADVTFSLPRGLAMEPAIT